MSRPLKVKRIGEPPPLAHEAALRRAVAPMLVQIRATLPRIRTLGDVRAFDAAVKKAWPASKIRRLVADIGRRAEITASRPWRVISARTDAAEYDGDALLEKWSKDAAKKITSVRDEVAEKLRSDIVAAAEAGIDHEALAARWLQGGVPTMWGTAEGRVRVIAQNQLAILHSEVQRARAQAVGISQFTWRTQGDDKVRPEHRALEGRVLDYSDPGDEGLPGHPVGCRCWAESVVPDDFLAEVSGVIET